MKIDIIKHKHEIDGKSTAAHAALLAPDDVSIYTYPDIPDYSNEEVVLIFPSAHAITLSQLFTENCDIKDIKQEDQIELPKGWNQSTLMKQKKLTIANSRSSKEINDQSNVEIEDLPNKEINDKSNIEVNGQLRNEINNKSNKEINDQSNKEINDRSYMELNDQLVHNLNNQSIKQTTNNNCDKSIQTKMKHTKQIPIKKAVFIDSTWNQSKGIYKDERIKSIPSVVIQNRISQFWRHQKGSPRWYLATIEAIHQFLVEIHLHAWGVHPDYNGLKNCFTEECLSHFDGLIETNNDETAYNGQYDNLLYFFQHMYDLIHLYYDHDNLYAYKRRMM